MGDRRGGYFSAGLFVGILLGVVAGVLLAPAKGQTTRRRLVRGVWQVADVARGVADQAEQVAEVLGERLEHYLGRDEELAWRRVKEIREGVERYSHVQAP